MLLRLEAVATDRLDGVVARVAEGGAVVVDTAALSVEVKVIVAGVVETAVGVGTALTSEDSAGVATLNSTCNL